MCPHVLICSFDLDFTRWNVLIHVMTFKRSTDLIGSLLNETAEDKKFKNNQFPLRVTEVLSTTRKQTLQPELEQMWNICRCSSQPQSHRDRTLSARGPQGTREGAHQRFWNQPEGPLGRPALFNHQMSPFAPTSTSSSLCAPYSTRTNQNLHDPTHRLRFNGNTLKILYSGWKHQSKTKPSIFLFICQQTPCSLVSVSKKTFKTKTVK